MIEIKELEKTYQSSNGSVVALRNVNLTIEDGDVFGIIGLSGAGKSTLVRCINLLERPTSGSVIIDGVDITKVKEKELRHIRSDIGMIFQGYNLLEQRNVIDNVCFPLELRKVKRADAVKRAKELLEIVGLTEKESAYPSQLSGGQKQRVAIARALATNPRYLLCDEATSALDPNTTKEILKLIKEINKRFGITVIIITHEMKVVETACNKVAVIDNSEIVETGFVTEIFASPKSEIARQLILPEVLSTLKHAKNKITLRIIFTGSESGTPFLSGLITEAKISINIIFADMKEIDNKPCGHMIIELQSERDLQSAIKYAEARNVKYVREA